LSFLSLFEFRLQPHLTVHSTPTKRPKKVAQDDITQPGIVGFPLKDREEDLRSPSLPMPSLFQKKAKQNKTKWANKMPIVFFLDIKGFQSSVAQNWQMFQMFLPAFLHNTG
jgi:hypothetical protein